MTCAPSAAMSAAPARPIPEAPPVTTTTLPRSLPEEEAITTRSVGPVVTRVAPARRGGEALLVVEFRAEAVRRHGRQVHRRLAAGDPFGQRFADGRRDSQPAHIAAGGDPQATNPGDGSDHVLIVGGHGREPPTMLAEAGP